MSVSRPSPFARPDTMLGICQALGDDFGFNPIFLRIALGVPVIWFPWQAIGAYLALGVLVLVSRFVFPSPRPAAAPAEAEKVAAEPVEAREPEALPIAA
ncbi:MAG TPA: PspC domain-containing protein [Allosphingosinicella sp.]